MPARRRRLALLAAPAILLVLAGAACSDDDDTTDDPTVTDGGTDDAAPTTTADEGGGDEGDGQAAGDPCAVLTPDQLEAAFSSPFDSGEATEQADTGGSQCVWTNTDAPPVKTFSVVVYTTESIEGTAIGQAADDAAGFYELNKGAAVVDEDLDIGDEAFRAATNVWVLDGDTVYSFSTFLGTSDEAVAGLVDLAEQAVDG